mgnify:CR=1 FL=1
MKLEEKRRKGGKVGGEGGERGWGGGGGEGRFVIVSFAEMLKNCKPKSDVSISWVFFLVPQLMIIASALLIPSFIESHL